MEYYDDIAMDILDMAADNYMRTLPPEPQLEIMLKENFNMEIKETANQNDNNEAFLNYCKANGLDDLIVTYNLDHVPAWVQLGRLHNRQIDRFTSEHENKKQAQAIADEAMKIFQKELKNMKIR